MVAKHSIKINGKWYKTGEEISPVEPQKKEPKQKQYTKTEINRMSTAELQALALENGIDGADEMTGAELKKTLVEKFEL